MKRAFRLLAFPVLILCTGVFSGCEKEENNNDDVYTISATMNGAQEVPAVTTNGTGTVSGSYNATNNSLQYNVSWSNLSATASVGHFHGPANPGANAGPIIHFNLINNGTSGTATGNVTLTDAQEADLLAGKWYANIHSPNHTGGEIRGQVAATK